MDTATSWEGCSRLSSTGRLKRRRRPRRRGLEEYQLILRRPRGMDVYGRPVPLAGSPAAADGDRGVVPPSGRGRERRLPIRRGAAEVGRRHGRAVCGARRRTELCRWRAGAGSIERWTTASRRLSAQPTAN